MSPDSTSLLGRGTRATAVSQFRKGVFVRLNRAGSIGITSDRLAALMDRSRLAVSDALLHLADAGLAERVDGRWRVTR